AGRARRAPARPPPSPRRRSRSRAPPGASPRRGAAGPEGPRAAAAAAPAARAARPARRARRGARPSRAGGSSPEVVETAAARDTHDAAVGSTHAHHGTAGEEAADEREAAPEPRRHAAQRRLARGGHRDHELVVLACLRGEGRRAPAERAPAGTGYREPAEIDLRPHPARPAELPHVLDEPVAHVD